MRLTIIQSDSVVGVNGVFHTVDLTGLDPTIHAIQYNLANDTGHVEFNDGKPNLDITDKTPYQVFYDRWVVANTPIPPTQAELDAIAAAQALATADAAAVTVVKANAVIQYLVTHTPAECAAKVQTDVTSLATAKDMLAHFAQALCVLAKDRLR